MVPLSAFFTIMFLSRDSSLGACRSPCDRLSFGLSNSIFARSNLTSSKKVSSATEGWTGGSQLDLLNVERVRFFLFPAKYVIEGAFV